MQDALVSECEKATERESCTGFPWILAPYELVSWWDMKPFPIVRIVQFIRSFEQGASDSLGSELPVASSPEEIKLIKKDTQGIAEQCKEWGFVLTADQFERISESIKENTKNAAILPLVTDALNRLEDECKRILVMRIEAGSSQYFTDAQFFDPKDPNAKKVSTEFPSAAEDIGEAGKCLACGRSTACVMHLQRIVEVGLRALANALGIPEQNDWGKYLSEIDKELEKRFKAAGARTLDEQFYSEAALTIDTVRRAWRNPTMHVEKTYTSERAEEILIAVRSFMRHLAGRLHD